MCSSLGRISNKIAFFRFFMLYFWIILILSIFISCSIWLHNFFQRWKYLQVYQTDIQRGYSWGNLIQIFSFQSSSIICQEIFFLERKARRRSLRPDQLRFLFDSMRDSFGEADWEDLEERFLSLYSLEPEWKNAKNNFAQTI